MYFAMLKPPAPLSTKLPKQRLDNNNWRKNECSVKQRRSYFVSTYTNGWCMQHKTKWRMGIDITSWYRHCAWEHVQTKLSDTENCNEIALSTTMLPVFKTTYVYLLPNIPTASFYESKVKEKAVDVVSPIPSKQTTHSVSSHPPLPLHPQHT